MSSNVVYFISGHVDLTQEEFDEHYKKTLDEAINFSKLPDWNVTFVIGVARGADTMARLYLRDNAVPKSKITLYYAKYIDPTLQLVYKCIGPFSSVEAKDAAMTQASDIDIAWVRSPEVVKQRLGSKYDPNHICGTQKNIDRRAAHC